MHHVILTPLFFSSNDNKNGHRQYCFRSNRYHGNFCHEFWAWLSANEPIRTHLPTFIWIPFSFATYRFSLLAWWVVQLNSYWTHYFIIWVWHSRCQNVFWCEWTILIQWLLLTVTEPHITHNSSSPDPDDNPYLHLELACARWAVLHAKAHLAACELLEQISHTHFYHLKVRHFRKQLDNASNGVGQVCDQIRQSGWTLHHQPILQRLPHSRVHSQFLVSWCSTCPDWSHIQFFIVMLMSLP